MMTDSAPSRGPIRFGKRRVPLVLMACAAVATLGGCTQMPDAMSGAFVDPAKYDLYNCLQLRTARRENSKRVAELRGLVARAETGSGGPVVSEVAYGNDLVSARASAVLAEEVWQRNHCDSEKLPPEKPDSSVGARPTMEPVAQPLKR
jgi:hypothetical protein